VTVSTADVVLAVVLEAVKYKLTVQTTPAASTIKFDNSKLEYRPGMELAPGRYDLVVSHEGYQSRARQVTISNADVTLPVTLPSENTNSRCRRPRPIAASNLINSPLEVPARHGAGPRALRSG